MLRLNMGVVTFAENMTEDDLERPKVIRNLDYFDSTIVHVSDSCEIPRNLMKTDLPVYLERQQLLQKREGENRQRHDENSDEKLINHLCRTRTFPGIYVEILKLFHLSGLPIS